METDSHAVTRVKNEGAGTDLLCWGPRFIGLNLAHGLCPVLSPDFLSYWSSPLGPSPKAEIHHRLSLKIKMKVQILKNIKFSLYTVAQFLEYKMKQ